MRTQLFEIFEADYCSRVVDGPKMSFGSGETMRNQVVKGGSRAVFECVVVSAPQARISWYHNGMQISSEDGAEMEHFEWQRKGQIIGMGVVQSKLLIPCADMRTAGEYTCRADSPCGNTISTSARLDVIPAPGVICRQSAAMPPTITTMTSSRIEFGGNSVQLICRVIGVPSPTISWSLADNESDNEFLPINDSKRNIQLANGDLLVTAPNDIVASQTFRCTAHNEYGDDHLDASVIYLEPEGGR
uniref:Ig-like domain-containing protein n=1 Tax=Ascaris lumbricoides TaxID=6252 RepID=A0A0M3IBW8_ASCLU